MKVHWHWALAGWHSKIALVAIAGVVVLGWLVGYGLVPGLAMVPQGTVTIAISPSSRTVTVGEIFTLDIRIDAGGQPVDTAAAFIDFNPAYLIVVDANGNPVSEITPGSALSTVLQNSVDNNAGRIDYTAGLLTGTPPSGSFNLATIRFKAKVQTAGGGTPITFGFSPPARNTDVLYQGTSVLGAHVDGNVTIQTSMPTATPTRTQTPTPTSTPTPTRTPTPSPTPTSTRSFLYLPVIMKNYTPGGQPTATRTPTATLATGSICVLAYNDLNGNSLRDQGEPLIAGATVTVATSGGTLVGVRITDGTEPYCFTGLAPGAYTVQEQNPPGYVSTTWDTWGVTVDAGYSTVVEFGDRVSPTSTSTATPSRTPTATPTRTPTATPTATATPTGPPPLVVNTTNDVDDGTCNATHCSLREALNTAGSHPGPDAVTFNIPTTDPGYNPATGVWTIKPANGYNVPSGTTVDGTIMTALAGEGSASRPGIEIDGTTLGQLGVTGLWLYDGVTLRGLIVNDFQYGIWVASANVTIEDCYVGTDPTGTSAKPNGTDGILLANGATGVVIQGNLLSGNNGSGLRMFGENTTGNTLRNNRVGTRADGTGALPNGSKGVYLHAGAHNNTIGPDNLVAFNNWEGVQVDGAGTRGNTISRNRIHSNAGKGIRLTNGGNYGLGSPVITAASTTQVSGTSCANCVIEVFSDAADEGAVYEGSTTANAAGNWTFSKPGVLNGPYVTATATDGQGNTSEFSAPASVSQAPTASPLA